MGFRKLPVLAVFLCLPGLTSAADLKTDQEKLSYTIGFQIGQNLKREGIDLDVKAFGQAIEDVMKSKESRLSMEEMQATVNAYREKLQQEHAARGEKNQQASEAFLSENKKKKGVTTLPSGLQYEVLEPGKGKSPAPSDTVVVNYRGTLIDGTEFDSSYKRGTPATLQVNGVIKGWQEALPLMKEGAKWRIFVPSQLAYGPRGAGEVIGPNQALIFEIELVSVEGKEAAGGEKK